MMICCRPLRLTSLSIALALAGCADDLILREPPQTPLSGNERALVTGRVVDSSGAAISGATVALRATGEQATTNSSGAFSLDVPANTTLTLATTAQNMGTTLLQQFMVTPGGNAEFTIPVMAGDRLKSLAALGANPMGGVVAITVKSLSGTAESSAGATVAIAPSNLGTVMYAPESDGMPDPDPSLTGIGPGSDCIAWGLGVQPHVSVMTFTLRGASQIEPPYSIDDVIWPGTFTVDAGSLTVLTLFTP